MQTIPTPVEITPEQAQKLRELEEKKLAIQGFINAVMQQGQQIMEGYNAASKQAWLDIAGMTGIDIETTIWVPHQTENKVVPVQCKINQDILGPDAFKLN